MNMDQWIHIKLIMMNRINSKLKKIISSFKWNQDSIAGGLLAIFGIIVILLMVILPSLFHKPLVVDERESSFAIKSETKCVDHQTFVVIQVNNKIFVKQLYKTKTNDQFGYPELITTVECAK